MYCPVDSLESWEVPNLCTVRLIPNVSSIETVLVVKFYSAGTV